MLPAVALSPGWLVRSSHVPDGNEEEPTSDADDDFDTNDFDTAEGLAAREAEHERAAAGATAAGVPARRSGRAAAAAATAAADAAREKERAPMPTDGLTTVHVHGSSMESFTKARRTRVVPLRVPK